MKTAKEEIEILLEHYNSSKDAQIVHRAQVVILYLKSHNVGEISTVTFKSERTISRWIRCYCQIGIGSIFPGYYNNQNASKLTREQKREVKELLDANPLNNKFWTIADLKSYLSARFDVEYKSKQSYCGLLQLCNYSYKLPSLFNIRRDDDFVEKRMAEIREEIKPLLKDPKWEVFVSDETRLEWNTLSRRAWLRKGKKTVIKEIRDRKYQNYIGFLNLKDGSPHIFGLPWQNQEYIIPKLEKMLDLYSPKNICIIWDNAGFHRGKVLRSHLGKGNKLGRTHLINLPPYAPDKNPQEFVWRYAKDGIGNQVYNQFQDLTSTFEKIVMGRKYHYNF